MTAIKHPSFKKSGASRSAGGQQGSRSSIGRGRIENLAGKIRFPDFFRSSRRPEISHSDFESLLRKSIADAKASGDMARAEDLQKQLGLSRNPRALKRN